MLQRIETEHRDKLEQLGKLQLEHDSALDFQKVEVPLSKPVASNASVSN